jgi:hypothetical protein
MEEKEMKYSHYTFAAGALVAALTAAAPASAQTPTAATPAAATEPANPLDTAVIGTLNRMASYLGTLTAFEVHADITQDKVLPDGQKVELMSTVDLVAERPSRLRLSQVSDRAERQFVYDGMWLTLWAPRLRYYTKVAAPPTLAALSDTLEAKLNIELPLVDLFRWGTDAGDLRSITSAQRIGPSTIEGITCEQFALRQDGLDWQIWVQKGDFPLPRKIVLTTTTDEARPQYSATYKWNLAPSYSPASFTFEPPEGAHEIPIATVTAQAQAEGK